MGLMYWVVSKIGYGFVCANGWYANDKNNSQNSRTKIVRLLRAKKLSSTKEINLPFVELRKGNFSLRITWTISILRSLGLFIRFCLIINELRSNEWCSGENVNLSCQFLIYCPMYNSLEEKMLRSTLRSQENVWLLGQNARKSRDVIMCIGY